MGAFRLYSSLSRGAGEAGTVGNKRSTCGNGWIMSSPDERPNVQRPPDWAVDQATDELDGVDDPAAVEERAWQLVHDAEQREEERHDEYDDPDQGGEA